ncbi:MAG: tetratricopeptide repeat protein [Candidatus Omnitrophica bacterium]|nr:tetratricopeptide repeat protein [Candidatus Omnitrophota bacterium]
MNIPLIRRRHWALGVILFLTFICYLPVLQHQFLNWDDPKHLLDNTAVASFNLREIFTTTVSNVYVPLTLLSFAIEHHFFGFNPLVFHLNNLFLHLAVTALVFIFVRQLGLPTITAAVSACIFGLHPAHVESVAWITERKDVLYAFFYLNAMIFYLKHQQHKRRCFYLLSLLAGFLSILAKPMALSLPFVMLLGDWFVKRKWSFNILGEKLIHFFYIIPLAWITFHQNINVMAPSENLIDSFLIAVLSVTFYLEKFFLPIKLTPVYIFPEEVSLFNSIYLKALVLFIGVIFLIFRLRRSRFFIFVIFFYILNIFYLIRFAPIGYYNWVADRFMYLPSVGFCLLIGMGIYHFLHYQNEKRTLKRWVLCGVVIVFFTGIFMKTLRQIKIWRNSETLWSYVIKHYPNNDDAYVSRGGFYNDQGQYELAIKDFNRAIALNPNYAEAFNNRGLAYLRRKDYEKAYEDFSRAVTLDKNLAEGYHNRSEIYKIRGEFEKAIHECNKAIEIRFDYKEALNDRAIIYLTMKDYSKALEEFNLLLRRYPYYKQAYNNRGVLFLNLGQYDNALDNFEKALALDPDYVQALTNRGTIYAMRGQNEKARQDFKHVLRVKPSNQDAITNLKILDQRN